MSHEVCSILTVKRSILQYAQCRPCLPAAVLLGGCLAAGLMVQLKLRVSLHSAESVSLCRWLQTYSCTVHPHCGGCCESCFKKMFTTFRWRSFQGKGFTFCNAEFEFLMSSFLRVLSMKHYVRFSVFPAVLRAYRATLPLPLGGWIFRLLGASALGVRFI